MQGVFCPRRAERRSKAPWNTRPVFRGESLLGRRGAGGVNEGGFPQSGSNGPGAFLGGAGGGENSGIYSHSIKTFLVKIGNLFGFLL